MGTRGLEMRSAVVAVAFGVLTCVGCTFAFNPELSDLSSSQQAWSTEQLSSAGDLVAQAEHQAVAEAQGQAHEEEQKQQARRVKLEAAAAADRREVQKLAAEKHANSVLDAHEEEKAKQAALRHFGASSEERAIQSVEKLERLRAEAVAAGGSVSDESYSELAEPK